MKMKKEKKCVTFWIEKEVIKDFDSVYNQKSYFIRECIKKAINDKNFYNNIVVGGKNEKTLL